MRVAKPDYGEPSIFCMSRAMESQIASAGLGPKGEGEDDGEEVDVDGDKPRSGLFAAAASFVLRSAASRSAPAQRWAAAWESRC